MHLEPWPEPDQRTDCKYYDLKGGYCLLLESGCSFCIGYPAKAYVRTSDI